MIALKKPDRFISVRLLFLYNYSMEELIKTLENIGIPATDLAEIQEHYRDNIIGLKEYVMLMRMMFDDRKEFVD